MIRFILELVIFSIILVLLLPLGSLIAVAAIVDLLVIELVDKS